MQENTPTVSLIDEREQSERESLRRLVPLLRAFRPEGFQCSVYTSPERWQDDRCGPWYAERGSEPFPEGFVAGDGTRVVWTIAKASDGLWRAVAGDLCGFYLEDAQVQDLVRGQGWKIARDRLSGDLVLLDENGERPIVPRATWKGECNYCGLCCFAPRLGTQAPCTALRPGKPDTEGESR